jgi:DNA-binding LacI/PurR family transcriptional regulator
MNLESVARRAKVSTATVSRTINGSDKVSPATAARVMKAIEALNFYPNTNARALGTGKSHMFGLIISDITNPFFPELVKAFEDIAVEHGQEVLFANTNYDPVRMEHCVRRMLQRKVDGVAIMTSEMDETLLASFSKRDIPMVFLDNGRPLKKVSNIVIDYKAGIDSAVQHLTELGHRRIAFISGPNRLASARTRTDAFLSSMAEHKIRVNKAWMREGNYRVDGGHDAMRSILATKNWPTALIASNDLTAIGAIGAIHEKGLLVPEDLSIIGFDDIQLSAYTQPPLTTLRVPRDLVATMAFHSLFQSYEKTKKVVASENVIHPFLVVRESTGPAIR